MRFYPGIMNDISALRRNLDRDIVATYKSHNTMDTIVVLDSGNEIKIPMGIEDNFYRLEDSESFYRWYIKEKLQFVAPGQIDFPFVKELWI